jgi:hypothetical protein
MIEIAGGIVLAVAIIVTLPISLPWLVVGVGLLVALVAVVLAIWGLVDVAQTEPLAFVLIGPILAWLIWYGYEACGFWVETRPGVGSSAMPNGSS